MIRVVETFGGLAEIDADGDGAADDAASLAALGMSDAERATLAQLYLPGDSVWRVPATHFTPYDCNMAIGYRTTPSRDPPVADDPRDDDPCKRSGSIVECQNQVLWGPSSITGTPMDLAYSTNRVLGAGLPAGRPSPSSGATVPVGLTKIELRTRLPEASSPRNSSASRTRACRSSGTGGEDVYGRTWRGRVLASATVTYIYAAVYRPPNPEIAQAFASIPFLSFIEEMLARVRYPVSTTARFFMEAPDVRGRWGWGGGR